VCQRCCVWECSEAEEARISGDGNRSLCLAGLSLLLLAGPSGVVLVLRVQAEMFFFRRLRSRLPWLFLGRREVFPDL
jgi:hypothetical protein